MCLKMTSAQPPLPRLRLLPQPPSELGMFLGRTCYTSFAGHCSPLRSLPTLRRCKSLSMTAWARLGRFRPSGLSAIAVHAYSVTGSASRKVATIRIATNPLPVCSCSLTERIARMRIRRVWSADGRYRSFISGSPTVCRLVSRAAGGVLNYIIYLL